MSEENFILSVDGIVAKRNKEPYVRLILNGNPICQMSVTEARKVASDLQLMASRTEADAMLIRFFDNENFPEGAAVALMHEFRMFRLALDEATAQGSYSDPETGEQV